MANYEEYAWIVVLGTSLQYFTLFNCFLQSFELRVLPKANTTVRSVAGQTMRSCRAATRSAAAMHAKKCTEYLYVSTMNWVRGYALQELSHARV